MRIEKISLRNYRQFEKAEIIFKKPSDFDLHVLIGTNGTGKTNILNAINWCLYGDEPHLSKDSEKLPIPNIKTIELVDEGVDFQVSAEVWVHNDRSEKIIFTRRSVFRKIGIIEAIKQSTEFEVAIIDEKNDTKIFKEDEAKLWVERIVPEGIRDFYFFDGERLGQYFKQATGQKILHAIFQIAQIDLLERLTRKVTEIKKEFSREAAKTNPKIEEKEKELESVRNTLEELRNRRDECIEQIQIAKYMIEEYSTKLIGIPDIESAENKRKKLNKDFETSQKYIGEKESEKQRLLSEYGKIIYLFPAISKLSHIITEKERKEEIPPTLNTGLLNEILRSEICKICGQPLNEKGRKHIHRILKDITISSEVANQLLKMSIPLKNYGEYSKQLERRIRRLGEEIQRYEIRLNEINEQIEKVDKELSGFDKDKIKEWHKERTTYENNRDSNQENLGLLKSQIQDKEKEETICKDQWDNEVAKKDTAIAIKTKLKFCDRSLDVLKITYDSIMSETRERIETHTKLYFLNLTWKTETFGDVKINEDYSINLIHSMGYSFLGSASAGERELLALAFTLALHRTSGFPASIIIDTPVARISDLHREKFADVLAEVSQNKQTILLFTPSEYSREVSGILDKKAVTRYELKLSSKEKTTNVEVL